MPGHYWPAFCTLRRTVLAVSEPRRKPAQHCRTMPAVRHSSFQRTVTGNAMQSSKLLRAVPTGSGSTLALEADCRWVGGCQFKGCDNPRRCTTALLPALYCCLTNGDECAGTREGAALHLRQHSASPLLSCLRLCGLLLCCLRCQLAPAATAWLVPAQHGSLKGLIHGGNRRTTCTLLSSTKRTALLRVSGQNGASGQLDKYLQIGPKVSTRCW